MNTQYNYPNLKKAVELLDESNYSEGQLVAYDKYVDSIRSWNSSMKLSYEEGHDEGRAEEHKLLVAIVKNLKAGISIDEIAQIHVVDILYVQNLKNEFFD